MVGVRIFAVGAMLLMLLFGVACGSTSNDRDLSMGDTETFASGNTVTVYSYDSPVQPTENLDAPTAAQVQPEYEDQYVDSYHAAIDVELCAADSSEDAGGSGNTSMRTGRLLFLLEGPGTGLFGLLPNDDVPTNIRPTRASIAPMLEAGNLPAGSCARGNVTFEVPPKLDPRHVVFEGFSQETARWAIEE